MTDSSIRLMRCANGDSFTAHRQYPVCSDNEHVWVWWGAGYVICAICHPPGSGQLVAPECQPF